MARRVAKTVAVIGGSGFIGQAVSAYLRDRCYAVAVLDLVPPGALPGCRYLAFDIRCPEPPDFAVADWDAIIVAAGVMAKSCNEDPDAAWAINVTATSRLLESVCRYAPRTRVIFLSSGMVYDAQRGRPTFAETASVAGVCTYTRSKLHIESALQVPSHGRAMTALILRPFTVFGDGALSRERGHLFGRWLELGRQGQPLTVYGDGSQVIDPVPVEYVAEACHAWLQADPPASTTLVNVTSGGPLTLRRLAELFVAAGLAPGIVSLPGVRADNGRGWGDAARFEALVGRTLARAPEAITAEFLQRLGRISGEAP